MAKTLNPLTDKYEPMKINNMSVTYHYGSLSAVADYFDNKAAEERIKEMRPADKVRLRDRLAARERAAVYESVAYMLRNTVIKT